MALFDILGGALNAIDLPQSMLRDLLGGENPFDQWQDPFGGSKRLSGRDLLRKAGLASQEDTWGNLLGGMALEMALPDPLKLITGTAVAGKVLRGATKRAKLDKVLDVYAARHAGEIPPPVRRGPILGTAPPVMRERPTVTAEALPRRLVEAEDIGKVLEKERRWMPNDERIHLEVLEREDLGDVRKQYLDEVNRRADDVKKLVGEGVNEHALARTLLTGTPYEALSDPDAGWPIPVYVSAPGDKNTVGLLVHRSGKKEMFEGNDEATPATLDLVNRLLGIGDRTVEVWGSHTEDVIERMKRGDFPEGIYVSPSRKHAEGYWGEGRRLAKFKIPLSRLSQESEFDWRIRPEQAPAETAAESLQQAATKKMRGKRPKKYAGLSQPEYAVEDQPLFYSRLERAIEQLPDKPIPSRSVEKRLQRTPGGVSAEELKFSGLKHHLRYAITRRGETPIWGRFISPTITKQELRQARPITDIVQVDVAKGGFPDIHPMLNRQKAIHLEINRLAKSIGLVEKNDNFVDTVEAILFRARRRAGTFTPQEYKIVESMRTLGDEYLRLTDDIERMAGASENRLERFTPPGGSDFKSTVFNMPGPRQLDDVTGHRTEYDNPLAWMLSKTHEVPGGRARIMHEAQSDVHQQGQSWGYTSAPLRERKAATGTAIDALVAELNSQSQRQGHGGRLLGTTPTINSTLVNALGSMIRSGADAEKIAKQTAFIKSILPASKVSLLDNYVAALKDELKVPDVPLKNWQDATLAQLLREAAEDQSITHVGILSGDDMSRWATGRGGKLKEDKVTQGLRIHANNYMPSRLEKIAKQLGVKELKLEKVPLNDTFNQADLDQPQYIAHLLNEPNERTRRVRLAEIGLYTDEEARAEELRLLNKAQRSTATVIRMTPELRRALLKKKGGALPLMSVAGPLAGATAAAGGAAALRQALNPPREEGT